MSKYVAHWYKVPARLLAAATKEGFKHVPSELALRAHDGDDFNRAFEKAGPAGVANFRSLLIAATICGVNYDPGCAQDKRQDCSASSSDPDCIPANIFAALPGPLLALLQKVFGEINDADEDYLKDFRASHSVVA